ncbi:hypothetical protein [Flavobacterium gelatinilyticum]|uniref:hypothetical protein n=1 Tax=Flavobacterium gelatinilyticum TaxID=3003260 RepID=UPI00248197E6|nr:hypothetical protein [Flavobacterium gelatinilyticum]
MERFKEIGVLQVDAIFHYLRIFGLVFPFWTQLKISLYFENNRNKMFVYDF